MAAGRSMQRQADVTTAPVHQTHGPAHWLLLTVGAAAAWAVLVLAMEQLWQRAFSFPTGEAWALSIGLMSMVAMLVALLVLVVDALAREEERSTR